MPICYITVSNECNLDIKTQLESIRAIVAEGLNSKSRLLDKNHITVRLNFSYRSNMLADIEIDIFAQCYLRRFFTRDKRANDISKNISKLLNLDCATWINLCQVGYSRHTTEGKSFYSVKEDNIRVESVRKKYSCSKTE